MSLTLVTGANGWLGTGLVKTLLNGLPNISSLSKVTEGRQLRCLVLRSSDVSQLRSLSNKLEIIEGDLFTKDSLKEFFKDAEGATLFHCAGIIHPKLFTNELFNVNVSGTKHLLDEAEASSVRRAIIVSSNSPAGANKTPDDLFNENSPYNPYMKYGKSKMLMEKTINDFKRKSRLETVIIRATWLYGRHQPARQTLFFSMIKEGKVPIIGDGNNKRSMTYIENLCQGLLLCEYKQIANGQTYWISDLKPYTMNEIINTIEDLLEKDFNIPVAHKRIILPYITSEIAMYMDFMLQSSGLYNQKIHVLSEMNKNIACSIKKAQEELGYNPKISLREGMKHSIKWCLDNGHKI